MADEGAAQNQDDISFLRTVDTICLSCTTTNAAESSAHERVCLAAEGFGNRMCFLQSMAHKVLPFDISVCMFVLEQALSVRALQEMVSAQTQDTVGQSSGHRTLLYGHAVQLRHSHSNMVLSCLSTQSSSSDKLAFDVGLTITPEGESCWWTIHPASKQRSEGEKVRVGDDLILVSVASERYLVSLIKGNIRGSMVIASFQQTLWTVQPVSSGAVRQKSLGFVFGGDVLRLFHGDECLTIPPRDGENVNKSVMYETGAVASHARSLWKLEHVRIKWSGSFMGWDVQCRLRHVTSGRYLSITEDNQVVTVHRAVATEDTSAFLLRKTKVDRKMSADGREDEGMGTADIKYGDSLVYLQHMKTGLWLSYQTFETKKRGVGRVEEKKVVVMVEGHMDDGLTVSRAQEEENKSARVIRKCTSLISRFVKALESLRVEGRNSHLWENISLAEVIKTLEDLIDYFAPPGQDLGFEERQIRLKALRNRQDLFQEEVMIALILETIDKCSQWKSMRHLAHLIGEDSAARWNDMINYLYLLLGALIQGNHSNCTQFASSKRIDWLVRRLEGQESSKGSNHRSLDVLHCVLIDSPEALNVIKEQHISTIISLIDKHGRDPKVLDVLCSLCVGSGVAVRSNQNLIMDNLLPRRDLLLQTRVVDHVYSMCPNIYVGRCEGSAMYKHWYYEAIIDHIEMVGSQPPHVRIGWGNTEGFIPYPGGGQHWGANGVGDDLFSYGFDGVNLWTAGKPKRVRNFHSQDGHLKKGDLVGVTLDLSVPQISFTVNGSPVSGFFRDFNLDGMFFPVISVSAKVRFRYMLGGENGKFRYGPPEGHAPVYESLLPKEKLRIEPKFHLGDVPKGLISGPPELRDISAFVPHPVETSNVELPSYVDNVREKLAENNHELWSMGKIEQGWSFNEVRDDARKWHPCLVPFDRLPPQERAYNLTLAYETLRSLVALGYHISYDPQFTSNTRMKTMKLPQKFIQPNNYKPQPLDLTSMVLNDKMREVVDLLAENTHNVWARERIKTGWTYGLNEVIYNRRSPHLVPYNKVDETIKKANRQTASEIVRTLMAYGYSLEPPTNEAGDSRVTQGTSTKAYPMRTYRAEQTYAVDSGKWYATISLAVLGLDRLSYAFDGYVVRKWHDGSEAFGKIWQRGDVIGCMLDITDKTISFSLNGELMMDRMGQEIAFKGIDIAVPFIPAFSIGAGQQIKVNFGQVVHTLKFFTTCGLQEGYEPFCVYMTRPMTLWYSKEQALFEPLSKQHSRLDVVRVPGGCSSPPCLKVNSKTYGTLDHVCLEYVRLSLPVKFKGEFIPPKEKQLALERRKNLANARKQQGTQHKDKHGLFKKKNKIPHSMDDTNMETMGKTKGGKLRRQSSETHLATDSHGKHSLIDKFTDVSKVISKEQTKKGKSPFKMFKKPKKGEGPVAMFPDIKANKMTSSTPSEYSEESDTESLVTGPMLSLQDHQHTLNAPQGMTKSPSMASYESGMLDSDADTQELEMDMDSIDEYYYGVRIFPGQDPAQVYVGWVTPQFHTYNPEFDIKKIRNVVVCSLDANNQLQSGFSRKNSYIVSAGDLQNRYSHQEDTGKRMTPGLLIGCHCDTSTGVLSFTVNGKEVANKFQVEPTAMLFPAVFFEPTNKEVLQFELGNTKVALPLSAVLFRGGKHVVPQCPPRLDLEILRPFTWARTPMMSCKVHTLKLSDIRGWSMLFEDPGHMLAFHIPEQDRCLDILELIEHKDLLKFHAHTLELYRAVCSHGNHRAAHELTHHVDEAQLMYCIRSKCMPGPLRKGLHQLLISLHLEALSNSRLMNQKEFIVPLNFKEKHHLYNPTSTGNSEASRRMRSMIPSLEKTASIRPTIKVDELKYRTGSEANLSSPFFPLGLLKQQMMTLLTEAVHKGAAHIRDPIGGSNDAHFVSLIKVVDQLLVMGLLDDRDLDNLLCLIDPTCFDPHYGTGTKQHGLLQIKLAEAVKKEVCLLLHHLTDCQVRHRIEAIIAFSDNFVAECQSVQKRRYIEVTQTDLPMAIAAKRTREFRCPPQEQMRALLSFRKDGPENEDMVMGVKLECPCSDSLRKDLNEFHEELLLHCNHPPEEEQDGDKDQGNEQKPMSWSEKLLALVARVEENNDHKGEDQTPGCFQKLVINTVIHWAKSDFISDQDLIREMFSLLHRQYDCVGEVIRSTDKAYAICNASKGDISKLIHGLGLVRSLLLVQVGPDEEEILKRTIWELADNQVFFQHPDLMRALGIHETVMQLMINTLNKAQQQSAAGASEPDQQRRRSSLASSGTDEMSQEGTKVSAADMVVACCRFLCYFCRTGSRNQRAMFEHLSYLLDNSCMLLCRPSLRGSCPLDVAYSSLMDNNELALALRESDLDKVAVYLSRCGQQSNPELIANGYPDMGWDPVEGERFIDFLRFCVWVNGESVEENANLVVRLLIRRPECLGPALRGEGGGLNKAVIDGTLMSLQIAASRDEDSLKFLKAVTEAEDDDRGNIFVQRYYNFSTLPPEDDEDYLDIGAARLTFYSSLVDLLGRCAPEADAITAGRSDSLRARAILRSLISLDDLEGVLGQRFILPVVRDDGEVETVVNSAMPPGLLPQHKSSIVLFLERVYGVEDQITFFRLLEDGFLPDLRAATTLDAVQASESDIALALNRYLCSSVVPLLTQHCPYFCDADFASELLDQTLHTVYRLSKCKSLTKNQRDSVSDLLVSLTRQLRAPMMTSLLRKLLIDVPSLTENTIVPLRVLTNHYERCGGYYGQAGSSSHGSATEEERRLTMMLFSRIFDSLAERVYDPELFSKALPCLTAIGCALSPDYSLSNQDDSVYRLQAAETDGVYDPQPVDTSEFHLTDQLSRVCIEFAEHLHDSWAMEKVDGGWQYGHEYDEEKKTQPNLRPFQLLTDSVKKKHLQPAEESLKDMLARKWTIDLDPTRAISKSQIKRKVDYTPRPVDLRNVTLTRGMLEMAEKVAENAHNMWAKRKKAELDSIGGGIHPQLVPYSVLTDKEKKNKRSKAQELLRFMQMHGFRVMRYSKEGPEAGGSASGTEKRFAYSLLEKLLEYVDKAAYNMKKTLPAAKFSRRKSFSTASEDVKFFGKVVLPLVEKYFRAHSVYFITNPSMSQSSGSASIKEKEMVCRFFSKLALLLRHRMSAFGFDIQITVRCLQTLVQAIDARSVMKSCPEMARSSLLPFFTFAADDLNMIVSNLKVGRFSHVKGTITRGATSLSYVHMTLIPVLTSMFDHLGRNSFGADLLGGEQQLCCYRILNAMYALGTGSKAFVHRSAKNYCYTHRHRPALGECIASFASTFPVAFLEPKLNIYNKNSVLYGIAEDRIQSHSLEAKGVMDQVAETVPPLEDIVKTIESLAENVNEYHEVPHVIEVTLPMLCRYLPYWWRQGPDNVTNNEGKHLTSVTAELMNRVLGKVLKLIMNNIGVVDAPWMNRIASRTQPIIANATLGMLKEHLLPVAYKLRENAKKMEKEEEEFHAEMRRLAHRNDQGDMECEVQEVFQILVRDIYAFYPLVIKYVDLHRSNWLKNPMSEAEDLYLCVADVFNLWSKSHVFKKEETNFVFVNEIDNMALIMPSQDKPTGSEGKRSKEQNVDETKDAVAALKRRRQRRIELNACLNVACLKRLLPIGLNLFGGHDQELVQQAKQRLIEVEQEADIEDYLRASYLADEKVFDDDSHQWQKALYKKIGSKKINEGNSEKSVDVAIERILAMAKVLYGLHLVEHPTGSMEMQWKKAVSAQRKRAVMACFRMIPISKLPRQGSCTCFFMYRAINLFIKSYREIWLKSQLAGHGCLIEDVTGPPEDEVAAITSAAEDGSEEKAEDPHPLSQLITAFSRSATTQNSQVLEADFLYISYAKIMSQSCHGTDDDDDDGGEGEEGDDAGASLQVQEMEKQKLLYEQNRLADRGAAEMVLMYISASKGQWSDMVNATIDLGISILRGGNVDVQKVMLEHLKEKKDVGFFTSVAGLMQQCRLLDLDAFERCNKAEGLGMTEGSSNQVKNLQDADTTQQLFRFLQLLCEGHNLGFQNYLRTQAGNTTTVNIIICTVDYLLRIQVSMMDFYWHYSGRDVIDPPGKESFFRAINVAAQIFCSITEYIQVPCAGNQLALAHSRLWDAVGGFLYIFAHMQDKLSKVPEQLELLREFMKLQKEMMIMLLSMLEGNVVNGPIGKQMVDTLVESSANFEVILKFFDIFLKMKDLTSSEAFMVFDTNKDGVISHKEFRRAMESQKMYTPEEIEYIMMCVDANQDGKVDFNEFTDRFHNPAKDIGFNVAVLLTNLSEHIPNDPRLDRFIERARSVLDYFEPYLGRIEIMGGAGRIERVYFEIKQSHIDQWEKPQIKVSKRAFLHSVVAEEGDKEKLEAFVNFCEDTVFEVQHATSISAEEQSLQMASYAAARPGTETKGCVVESIKWGMGHVKDAMWTGLSALHPSNIREKYHVVRAMTWKERAKGFLRLNTSTAYGVVWLIFMLIWLFLKFIYIMMRGEPRTEPKQTKQPSKISAATERDKDPSGGIPGLMLDPTANAPKPPLDKKPDLDLGDKGSLNEPVGMITQTETNAEPMDESEVIGEDMETDISVEMDEPPIELKDKGSDFVQFLLVMCARNFYKFKLIALAMAFSINILLLFFKVDSASAELAAGAEGEDGADAGDGDGDGYEFISMADNVTYLHPLLRIIALLHSLVAFAMMVAYNYLKVPLVVFKREKEIARSLEFDGMWVAEQPSDDDIRGHWDKLVISTRSFPYKYWDKFVKKKVRNKYSEQYDYDQISTLLGMEKADGFNASLGPKEVTSILPSLLTEIDWQYQFWKSGIILTDQVFLYIVWYFSFSVLGNYNPFFFAAHLLDVAICFKTLGTILQSVTHNGKQVVLTVLLTSIVVYLYTVIAFNFFRKFYVKDEDGDVDYKCHDMLTVYVYHLYVGVRAGGGIGDEIESPDGDPYEGYRILFDITFFFFVIIILLAIIQGLIIDAFGELRDQLEQVKEDLEVSCFICGIGKDYFDKMPHGFETHVKNEHNFANYMFFLMHLINKPDTEYTGQVSYVWELYQERSWDFFPVGDSFRKQYEDELGTS
uniref:Ryanodine receptor n=1 Tax=Capitella teleta TaxID=283909 RepID=X1Z8I7_CAPTE